MTISHLHVIINPAAGQDEIILNTLNRVFTPASFSWSVDITQNHGDGATLARKAVDEGADAVAVYGGDGTIVEVTSALAHQGVPVGILPGGTGNALSLGLKIPQNLKKAAQVIADPDRKIVHVDVGKAGDQVFTVGMATGFMAETIGTTNRQSKDQLGLMAYTKSLVERMGSYTPAHYVITLDDDRVIEREAVTVYVLNVGTFGLGQVSLIPESRATDGLLHVVVVEDTTPGQILAALASAASLKDSPLALPRWNAKRVLVESTPAHRWMVDGDAIAKTPVEAHVEAGALPCIVPKGVQI